MFEAPMMMKWVNVTLFPFAPCAEMSKRSVFASTQRRGKIHSTLIYETSLCFLKRRLRVCGRGDGENSITQVVRTSCDKSSTCAKSSFGRRTKLQRLQTQRSQAKHVAFMLWTSVFTWRSVTSELRCGRQSPTQITFLLSETDLNL